MKSLKKIGLIGAALSVLAIGGFATAQVVLPKVTVINPTDLFQDLPNGQTQPTNIYATAAQLRSWVIGQGIHTSAPTLTTTTSVCGGSTAVLTSGTDTSGQIAEGTTASTSCVITFAVPYLTAPECFTSLNNVADTALKCATTTTTATITQTSASSNVLNYLIVGLAGG